MSALHFVRLSVLDEHQCVFERKITRKYYLKILIKVFIWLYMHSG